MDKKIGQKLNHIWDELRTLPENIAKITADAFTHVAKSLEGFATAQTEAKGVLDKLLVISEADNKKRTIEGVVEVKALYDEMDKALKANTPAAIDYPELQKMFQALGAQVDGIEFDAKAIARELVKALPKQKELTIDKKIEVFGKTITKLEGNTPKTPLFVSVVNSSDLKGSGSTVVSQGGSIPDDLIEPDGAGGRRLKVTTSSGGVANVGIKNAAEGRINPATLEQQVAQTADLDRKFAGGKKTYSKIRTANDLITPAAGKAIRVLRVIVIPSADNAAVNPVTIKFTAAAAGNNIFQGYAVGFWEPSVGAVDDTVSVALTTGEPVAVTIHYEEF